MLAKLPHFFWSNGLLKDVWSRKLPQTHLLSVRSEEANGRDFHVSGSITRWERRGFFSWATSLIRLNPGPGLSHVLLTLLALFGAISEVQGQDRAFVMASFPRNGAEGLSCATPLSLQLHFPAESRTLDPITIHDGNVRLYRLDQDERAIRSEMTYNVETKTLTVVPGIPLAPHSSYVLSTTPGLVDDRGFSIRPFFIRFSTGDCPTSRPALAMRGNPEMGEPAQGPRVFLRQDSLVAVDEINRLKWVTYKERMISEYLIYRQDTGAFREVARIGCPGDNDSLQAYLWVDPIPSYGWNRYRLVAVTIMGDTLELDTLVQFRRLVAFPNTDAIWQGRLPVVTWLQERTAMVAIIRDLDHEIVRKQAGWAEEGDQFWTIELGVLDPGEYRVQLFLGKDSYFTEILVTE